MCPSASLIFESRIKFIIGFVGAKPPVHLIQLQSSPIHPLSPIHVVCETDKTIKVVPIVFYFDGNVEGL